MNEMVDRVAKAIRSVKTTGMVSPEHGFDAVARAAIAAVRDVGLERETRDLEDLIDEALK